MINIIKHGKKKITKTFYICICPGCKCEFEVTADEFKYATKCSFCEQAWTAGVECPDCGIELELKNTVSIREEDEFIDYEQLNSFAAER